ncbi:MAG: hypothetical protein AB1468_00555 [Candidatus Micrarchaeota archaeon]
MGTSLASRDGLRWKNITEKTERKIDVTYEISQKIKPVLEGVTKGTPDNLLIDSFWRARGVLKNAIERLLAREKPTMENIVNKMASDLWLSSLSSISDAFCNLVDYKLKYTKPSNKEEKEAKNSLMSLIKEIQKIVSDAVKNEKKGKYGNSERLDILDDIKWNIVGVHGLGGVAEDSDGVDDHLIKLYGEAAVFNSKDPHDPLYQVHKSYGSIVDTISRFEKESALVESVDLVMRTLRGLKGDEREKINKLKEMFKYPQSQLQGDQLTV